VTELPETITWRGGAVRIVDQRRLPEALEFVDCATVDSLVAAVTSLAVRGAPAIGAAGAFGVALAAYIDPGPDFVENSARILAAARPTAVNLAWGVGLALDGYRRGGPLEARRVAERIATDDVTANRQLGAHGSAWLLERFGDRPLRVLTHCNAGHLATVGFGTAIGIVRAHAALGLIDHVWVDETRPLLQGARLTAWELAQLAIPHTVIVDSAAASRMAAGSVDVVIVGADRVAANGDVANKIGTYSLAVLAHHHDIPFVVAAPLSTVDAATPSGAAIVVEDRDRREVGDSTTIPERSGVANPAFDVTPAALISVLVTERGTPD
jgi:methylthioribose-1-phosphate isomerase